MASDADEVGSDADEVESDGDAKDEEIFLPPKNEEEAVTHLHAVLKSPNPPVPERNITYLWYGAVYMAKKKPQLYIIGKAIHRFLTDEYMDIWY